MFELKNVIAVGDYKTKAISAKFGSLLLNTEGTTIIPLDKRIVKSFAEIPDSQKKKTRGIYIKFKDGKKSIVDVNDKVFNAFNIFCPRNDKMKMDENLLKEYRQIK